MCATTKYVSEVAMSIGTAPSMIPERPPITNMETNPSANNIGVVRWMRPSQVVANHEKTLIPVGTAIRSVVTIIGTRSQVAMPETNMWFAQTSSGMRQNVIPGARMVMIVTRKLRAVMIEDAPAHWTPMLNQTLPLVPTTESGA